MCEAQYTKVQCVKHNRVKHSGVILMCSVQPSVDQIAAQLDPTHGNGLMQRNEMHSNQYLTNWQKQKKL